MGGEEAHPEGQGGPPGRHADDQARGGGGRRGGRAAAAAHAGPAQEGPGLGALKRLHAQRGRIHAEPARVALRSSGFLSEPALPYGCNPGVYFMTPEDRRRVWVAEGTERGFHFSRGSGGAPPRTLD